MVTNPHDELRAWMERAGRATAEVAEILQITRPHLSHLVNGGRSPSLALAARIASLTGIPITAWVKADRDVSRDDMEGVASV
jgi:transcriptional regulator with XRE-family HTH domain